MTYVFNNFIEQYNSTGSQKAAGYDLSYFDGMSIEEKEKAFDLLVKEFIAPGVTEWLFYLDFDKAKYLILTYISNVQENQVGIHRLYAQLYNKTGDKVYQDYLIDNYERYLDWEKNEAVWLVHNSKPDKKRGSDFYKQLILSEKNLDAQSSAADFFLRINGCSCKTKQEKTEFFRIRKILESGGVDNKLKEIALIED